MHQLFSAVAKFFWASSTKDRLPAKVILALLTFQVLLLKVGTDFRRHHGKLGPLKLMAGVDLHQSDDLHLPTELIEIGTLSPDALPRLAWAPRLWMGRLSVRVAP